MEKTGFVQVENHGSLLRDQHSKAIISTDSAGLARAKALKLEAEKKRKLAEEQTMKINTLEIEMKEIKHLLQDVLALVKTNSEK